MARILFLPSAEPGNGTGHIVRAFRTASELVEKTSSPGNTPGSGSVPGLEDTAGPAVVKIFIPREQMRPGICAMVKKFPTVEALLLTEEESLLKGAWDFAVWDRKASTEEEFTRWKHTGIPVGIDEGGPLRDSFALLIDTFPLPPRFRAANLSEPGFLPQPEHRRGFPGSFEKILVSFGGEDPAGLTEKTLSFLIDEARLPPGRITVVAGPLFGKERLSPFEHGKLPGCEQSNEGAIEVLLSPGDLAERLYRYDLVCTSFGLTAYEAVSAGCGVVLVNPSEYHTELSEQAGFPVAGTGEIDGALFLHFLKTPKELERAAAKVRPKRKFNLSDYLSELRVPEVEACPFCGKPAQEVLERLEGRTFYRCGECGLVYQRNFHPGVGEYGEDYFFSEYRGQYGRSYLEDFENLRSLAKSRIGRIRRIGMTGGSVLDVGCAYGPFLLEARLAGFEAAGLDPVRGAADYVRNELGIPAVCTPFEEYEPGAEQYDLLTMWYVIEHFADLRGVLEKVRRLLRPGGVFAFSTPNLEGITGRGRYGNFLRTSPEDHHTVWSPAIAGEILRRAGFSIEKIVNTGHHPERFHLFGQKGVSGAPPGSRYSMRPLVNSVLKGWSRAMKLGDTFEVYARKSGGFDVR